MKLKTSWKIGSGAACLVMTAGLGAAAPAAAHPHPSEAGDGKPVKVERIIVLSDRDAKGKDGKQVRRFHVEHLGPGEPGDRRVRVVVPRGADGPNLHALRLEHCDSDEVAVDEKTTGDRKEKTKVIICGHGDGKVRVARLEEALGRITANEHLSVEHREEITARLRETIERLRSEGR